MLDKLVDILKENQSRIAYIINDDRITYGELLEKSLKMAYYLRRQGSGAVIVYGHKSIDMVISIVSCLIARRTYIPIDNITPINRVQKIIQITGADLIIQNENLENSFNIEALSLQELSKYQYVAEKTITNSVAYIIFTSGSTGEPKGVPISYDNLNNFSLWISHTKPLSDYYHIQVFNQANFSFDLSVAGLYYSLLNGNTLIGLDRKVQEQYNPIFDIFKCKKVNVMIMTPTFIKLCLLNEEFNERNYPELRVFYFCGEKLEKSTVEKIFEAFPNIQVVNAYGPTEATCAVSSIVITPSMLESEKILPVGEVGHFATDIHIDQNQIILTGKSVFNGYLGNVSGGYFESDGVNGYKTGDMGFIQNNKLYCQGRLDSQVKYKGYRIELNDIETNLLNIEGVRDCAVVAKLNIDNTVKMIKAFVVLEQGYELSFIKEELKTVLPEYMVPKVIHIMDKIPVNKNGKIDRKLLSEL